MLILAMTTDSNLINQLKPVGQVMQSKVLEHTKALLDADEVDAVVIGTPFENINLKLIEHDNVYVLKNKNDVTRFLKQVSKSNIADDFYNDILLEEQPKPKRKIRALEETPEEPNLDPYALGKILLVTTNYELIKYLSDFDLQITTTRFTAIKALRIRPKIVIWDIEDDLIDVPGILTYQWGNDLLHLEDVIQVLTNLDITL